MTLPAFDSENGILAQTKINILQKVLVSLFAVTLRWRFAMFLTEAEIKENYRLKVAVRELAESSSDIDYKLSAALIQMQETTRMMEALTASVYRTSLQLAWLCDKMESLVKQPPAPSVDSLDYQPMDGAPVV